MDLLNKILIFFIVLFFIRIYFIGRKQIAHDAWIRLTDAKLIKLMRIMSKQQQAEFNSSTCEECNADLPENTVKTHDGFRLCSSCKVKHFNKKLAS